MTRPAPAFVGRRRECAWLARRLDETVSGTPRLVLLSGEAGLGKTRLLHEFEQRAREAQLYVCRGRACEGVRLPYLVFAEILRDQLADVREAMTRALGDDAAAIEATSRGEGLLSGLDASGDLDLATRRARMRLFLAVSRATIALARVRPTLLVVDDLHWADELSVEQLRQLSLAAADAAGREALPLLIVAAHRPPEPESRLERTLSRLRRERVCETLELGEHSESEVGELIVDLGIERPARQLVSAVYRVTRGNPLFVQELVHHLVAQGALCERGSYLVNAVPLHDAALPDDLESAIAANTRRISEACRIALTDAACLAGSFSPAALAALRSVDEEILLDALEEAVTHRILIARGDAFEFRHPLVRQVFYTAPSGLRRQRIHARIAERLEDLHADAEDDRLLEIAHHLVRAGPRADPAKLASVAARAGDHAFARLSWNEAARFYEAAAGAAERQGRPADAARLHFCAGHAHFRNMDTGPCLDQYEQAIASFRRLGDASALARTLCEHVRAQLTLAAVPYGTLAEIEPLEAALEALPEREVALRGQACAMLAEAYWIARQPERAEPMARRALALGRQIGDDRLCALVSSVALATTHIQRLHLHDALRSLEEGLVHARSSGDPRVLGWPLQRIPIALITLGRLDEAERAAQEACDLARVTDDWAEHSLALASFVFVAVSRGELEHAEEYAREALLLARRARYPWGIAMALPGLACARALRGGAGPSPESALEPLVERGDAIENERPLFGLVVRVYRELLAARAGTLRVKPEALLIRRLIAGSRNLLDMDLLGLLCAGVETARALADIELARLCYEPLRVAAGRGLVFPRSGWVFLLPRVLGVAATWTGGFAEAEAHFERALEIGEQAGALPELARARVDYAQLLLERGVERERAAALLREAAGLLRRLDMQPDLERALHLAARLGIQLAPAASDGPLELSRDETELLLLITRGWDVEKIARELGRDAGAVAGASQRLLARLGAADACDAANHAARLGLFADGPARAPAPQPPVHQALMITDMANSTPLIERLGDERAQSVMRTHNVILRACLREHAGHEIQHAGDGIIASFPSAACATRCAVAIQQDLSSYNARHAETQIRVRIGLHAGRPRTEENRLFGAAVNATSRICHFADAGEILASEAIREHAGELRSAFRNRGLAYLKGFAKPFRLHEVAWTSSPAPPAHPLDPA